MTMTEKLELGLIGALLMIGLPAILIAGHMMFG